MTSETIQTALEGVDERGRYYSPYIARGDDMVPASVGIPGVEEMRGLSDVELAQVAHRFGGSPDIRASLAESESFLKNFNVMPGDDGYAAAMLRLEADSRRVLLGRARQAAQRYETMIVTGGDLTGKRLIVVNESAEPCDACAPLGGRVGTYAELAADNALPWDVCEGGTLCQCCVVEYG